MKQSTGPGGALLATMLIVATASQPVAGDDVCGVLQKGDRHLRPVAESRSAATVFVTVEERFPDQNRSVLRRVPLLAAIAE